MQIPDQVTDWLLEEDNPPVRFLTLTNLLGKSPRGSEVRTARSGVMEYRVTQGIDCTAMDYNRLPEGAPQGTTNDSAPAPAPGSGWVMSIDALRGCDMFWIIGGRGLVLAVASRLQPAPRQPKGWTPTRSAALPRR